MACRYILACYAIVTLPKEAELISPNKKAIYLGSLLGLAGISQLSGPVAGYFSDRCTHKMVRTENAFQTVFARLLLV